MVAFIIAINTQNVSDLFHHYIIKRKPHLGWKWYGATAMTYSCAGR